MIDIFRALAKRNPGPAKLLAAVDGVSTIEFAVTASMLGTLAIGMLDFGMGLWQQMQVGNAARAGAQYASIKGYDSTRSRTRSPARPASARFQPRRRRQSSVGVQMLRRSLSGAEP